MRPALLQTDTLNQVAGTTWGRQPRLETFQLYLSHPEQRLAVALIFRLVGVGAQGFGEVEALVMQPDKPLRRAVQRWPLGRVQGDPERAGVGIAECSLQHNATFGLVRGEDFAISWELALADRTLGYAGLPEGFGALSLQPSLMTPHPASRVLRGKVEVWEGLGRRTAMHKLDLKGWLGMQGHWLQRPDPQPVAWVHATHFEGTVSEPTTFEAYAGRFTVGRLLHPTALVGRLVVGGIPYRFDGWRNLFARPTEATTQSWSFEMRHGGAKLRASLTADEPATALSYPGPREGEQVATQLCMLAKLELIFEPHGGLPQTLVSQRATYLTQKLLQAAPQAAAG